MRVKLLVAAQRPPQCPPTLIKHHGSSMISAACSRNIGVILSPSDLAVVKLMTD